jgi:hypothetical protein
MSALPPKADIRGGRLSGEIRWEISEPGDGILALS